MAARGSEWPTLGHSCSFDSIIRYPRTVQEANRIMDEAFAAYENGTLSYHSYTEQRAVCEKVIGEQG